MKDGLKTFSDVDSAIISEILTKKSSLIFEKLSTIAHDFGTASRTFPVNTRYFFILTQNL